MTTYVFLPPPGYGHVNPTLAIANALVQRGQDVIYYLPEAFREAVQGIGAVFRPYDSKLMKYLHPTVMVEECRHVLPQVLDRICVERPDVIVYEPYLWARIVIEVLKVPMVVLPQIGDQFLTAQRVTERGLGIALDQEAVNATTLREAVERVASEPGWRANARQMQRVVHEARGYRRATDAILQFAETHARG